MGFRAAVRQALAAPEGLTLAQRFAAPMVTVIVAEAAGGAHEQTALAELTSALARVGLSRGRMMLLLAGTEPLDAAARASGRRLQEVLGIPVVLHDPIAAPCFEIGRLRDGTPIALDDELREAEAIVLVGEYSRGSRTSRCAGPFSLVPGLASPATHATFATLGNRAGLVAQESFLAEVLTLVPIDLALVWDTSDPPLVRAGGVELLG